MEMATFEVEVTDTFGGEANYSWVNRYTIVAPRDLSNRALVRRAKALAGWTGMRAATDAYGDNITVRPAGLLQVMFITVRD